MTTAVRPAKVAAGRVVKVMLEHGWRPPTMTDRTLDRLVQDMAQVEAPELPTRQQEALQLAADGLTKDQIADELGISEGTVHEYLKRLRRRLHARNTAHAVAIALRLGVIE